VSKEFLRKLSQLWVTPRAFAFFSIVSVLSVPFGDFQIVDTPVDVLLEITLGLIATGALALFLWPTLSLLSRFSRPGVARFSALMVVLFLGGVLRGVIIHVGGPTFSFDVATSLVQRVGNSVSTTVVWLSVLALFVNATQNFQKRYNSLLAQLTINRASSVPESEVRWVLRGLEEDLKRLPLLDIDEARASQEMYRVARALRDDIVEKIRAHSRDLWVVDASNKPRLKFFPLLRLAVAKLEYSKTFVMTVFGLVGLANLSSLIGFPEASVRIGAALLVILVFDIFYRRYVRRRALVMPWLQVVYLVSVGVAVMWPMGLFEFFTAGSPWGVVYLLLLPLPTAALPVMESTLNLAQGARDELLASIATVEKTEVSGGEAGGTATSSAQLASYLHNSLQSEIQSIIVALEGASGHPDKVALGQASLERLRLLASKSLDEDFRSFTTVPLEHLEQVMEGWRGILDISLTWSAGDDVSGDPRIPSVVQIIQEVASNSVVHAGATTLDVTVAFEEDHFLVNIANNAPTAPSLRRGQGSQWLQAFSVVDEGAPADAGSTRLLFRV